MINPLLTGKTIACAALIVCQIVLAFLILTGLQDNVFDFHLDKTSIPTIQQETLYLMLLALHIVFGVAVHYNWPTLLKLYIILLTGHLFFVLVFALRSFLDIVIAVLSVGLIFFGEKIRDLLQPQMFVLRK